MARVRNRFLLAVAAALLTTNLLSAQAQAQAADRQIVGWLLFAYVGDNYNVQLSVRVDGSEDPGPWTWQITDGSLPPGLVLTPSGQLTGNPLLAGRYDFTLQATGAAGTVTAAAYTEVVQHASPPPSPPPDPVTTVGQVVRLATCALQPGMLQSTLSTLLYHTPPSTFCP